MCWAQGAWRRARGDGRLPHGSLIFAAGLFWRLGVVKKGQIVTVANI